MTLSKRFENRGVTTLSRRALVATGGMAAAALAAGPAAAQTTPPTRPAPPVAPPSTVTTPPRDFGPRGAPTTYFSDPDILVVDPSFGALVQPNSAIRRLWTGALWAEGPAWNAQGRYLVWSDIPNNRQLRWLEDDGRVSVFRLPSNNSNGNSFDFQGRQLSCEHLTRRVVRYELDGSATVLADSFDGKKLNSPNDVVAHPDGSYWFTDPPYGGQLYEGAPDAGGGPSNAESKLNPRLGQPPGIGTAKRQLPTNCYRVDPSGRVDLVVSEDQVPDPTGSASRPTTRRSTSPALARGRATAARAARARSMPSTSDRTTSRPTAGCSATSWSATSSAVPTGCAATWQATSGCRATPAAPWATTA